MCAYLTPTTPRERVWLALRTLGSTEPDVLVKLATKVYREFADAPMEHTLMGRDAYVMTDTSLWPEADV